MNDESTTHLVLASPEMIKVESSLSQPLSRSLLSQIRILSILRLTDFPHSHAVSKMLLPLLSIVSPFLLGIVPSLSSSCCHVRATNQEEGHLPRSSGE